MLPTYEQGSKFDPELFPKRDRNFPSLPLNDKAERFGSVASLSTESSDTSQPVLVIQSPKTPTLSRKLKAVSLDSETEQKNHLEVARDVFSVPNTPKRQVSKDRTHLSYLSEFDDIGLDRKSSLVAPNNYGSLKRFASNQSISGSQTLKTLPEIMTLQDFSDSKIEPVRIKAKGLLERRGSNASLTIDLGSNSSLVDVKRPPARLNTAKSVSNLNLTSTTFDFDKCSGCGDQNKAHEKAEHRVPKPDACTNCTIYEVPIRGAEVTRTNSYHRTRTERHCVCNLKYRRKSLSNENLYVPPCNFCHSGSKECHSGKGRTCRGYKRAMYPRQTYVDTSQLLSEDFKLHLQNIQYLQTAGSVLSVSDLKTCCEKEKLQRLHQEFWEVPLNLQEKCIVSGSQSMNRYRGVLPNEHSRVHLPEPQPYIHANYIKGPDYSETAYIATQGPLLHTCGDFWNMVWHCKVENIVMLTALVERGRNKCELYFPLGSSSISNVYEADLERKDVVEWDEYIVKHISTEMLGDCMIRQLELSKGEETRKVKHYWYPNWADHKLANPEQLLRIALHVLKLEKDSDEIQTNDFISTKQSDKAVPIVAHCSAGIGRTGCFLAILNGIRQLRSNFNVDILATLCSLRLNRGGMVQTAEQYELIHRVLSLYAESI